MASRPAPKIRPDDRAPPLGALLREAGAVVSLHWKSLQARRGAAPQPGESAPVLVIPGFLATDASTAPFRAALAASGREVHGWGLGMNTGARADSLDRVAEVLERVADGRPAVVIGWSLGGLFAREVAKRRADLVERVITLGSPFSGSARANNAWMLYELVNGYRVDNPPLAVSLAEKPPVPTFALWSRGDGIVAPACARGETGESDRSIEVACTHMGFMTAACVVEAVLKVMDEA